MFFMVLSRSAKSANASCDRPFSSRNFLTYLPNFSFISIMQSSLFVDYCTTDNYLHKKTKCQRNLWHIYIFPNTQTNTKKCKRATKPTHNDTKYNKNKLNGKMGDWLTGVLQYWGRSAIFELR